MGRSINHYFRSPCAYFPIIWVSDQPAKPLCHCSEISIYFNFRLLISQKKKKVNWCTTWNSDYSENFPSELCKMVLICEMGIHYWCKPVYWVDWDETKIEHFCPLSSGHRSFSSVHRPEWIEGCWYNSGFRLAAYTACSRPLIQLLLDSR